MQGLAPSQNQAPITSKLGTAEACKSKKTERKTRKEREKKKKKQTKQNKKRKRAKTKVSPGKKEASSVIPPPPAYLREELKFALEKYTSPRGPNHPCLALAPQPLTKCPLSPNQG